MRHRRHGRPGQVLRAALAELPGEGIAVERASPVISSAPLGPSRRRFANAAAVVSAGMEPGEFFAVLQAIESRFGRRRGQRWSARVLDLDIVLWEGGPYADSRLIIPHPRFRERAFVLQPCAQVAPNCRDPVTGLTIRQLHARLTRPRAAPR
jgi:2-amino-4-hydroxy-6-hydroxymethyldihydropteridine diphosphokinase